VKFTPSETFRNGRPPGTKRKRFEKTADSNHGAYAHDDHEKNVNMIGRGGAGTLLGPHQKGERKPDDQDQPDHGQDVNSNKLGGVTASLVLVLKEVHHHVCGPSGHVTAGASKQPIPW
tara:strand:- start:1084 stop:1437 length:354 start_codon:yes stop_codon:yes gene_type:complete